jgi:hypothetical protein
MEQIPLGEMEKVKKLDLFSKEEIISKYESLELEYIRALKEILKLKNFHLSERQGQLWINDQLRSLQAEIFGASSERYKKPEQKKSLQFPPSQD